MSLDWDTDNDFSEVVDTLEAIVLRRQGCPDDADTLQGWRFREVVRASEPYPSCARTVDTTWQLPVGDLLDPPRAGDVIVDESGAASTIRASSRLRGASRYTCDTRRIELREDKSERFDIDRPVYVATSEGTTVDRWERLRFAVEGCFELVAESTSERYELSLICPIPLKGGDRVHRHRGGVYRVESIESSTTDIGLSVLIVVEEAAYSAEAA